MEIQYKQRVEDYYNAYKYISRRLNSTTRWRYLSTLSGGAFGLLVTLGVISIGKHYQKYKYFESEELNYGLAFLGIGVIVLIVGIWIYNKNIRPLIFEDDWLYLSLQKFIVNDECLVQKMGENEHKYQWQYVKSIEKTNEYIFVFIDRAAALYIPRHAFSSEQDYAAFHEALQSHVQ